MDAKRCKAGCWKIAARDCVEVSAKGLRRSMRLSPLLVRVCPKKYLLYFFLHFFAMLLQQPHSEKAFEKLLKKRKYRDGRVYRDISGNHVCNLQCWIEGARGQATAASGSKALNFRDPFIIVSFFDACARTLCQQDRKSTR